MQQVILDETIIINRIRQFGEDIFESNDEESQISYTISQSQYHIQQRLQPFIKSIKPSKKQHKKGIKNIYSSYYVSPYSKQQTNERLSTSRTMHNQKSGNKNLRKKIFSFYNQQQKIEDQKQKTKKLSQNKKFENMKPRYLQKQPIIKNLSSYIQKNVYGRMKTQVEHLRPKSPVSKQQCEANWDNFIKKNNQWGQARQNSLIKARIRNRMNISHELQTRPPRRSPPQMTVDDCLQKLRRQAQKLKQKLNSYSFQPKLYESERRKYKLSKQKSRKEGSHQKSQSPQRYDQTTQRKYIKQNPEVYYKSERKFTVINNPKKQLDFIVR